MTATWKTKWGVRRVRRDTPTIEEALIAAESLANDAGARAEIAASLMGIPGTTVVPVPVSVVIFVTVVELAEVSPLVAR